MRFALILVAALAPAIAHADPVVSFEVADHGDTVEVIAHNVEARSTTISSIRQRLEIPLAGNPQASRQMMADPTVMQVELDGVSARVLSVKTRLDRPEVHALAPLAKATQVGTDLHLTFPRHAVIEAAAPTAIKPAVETKPAALIATKPAPETKPVVDTKPVAPATVTPQAASVAAQPPAAVVAVQPPATLPPAPTTATPLPPAPAPKLAPSSEPSNLPIYGGGGILALIAGGWMLRNRKKQVGPASTIDIIAQRSLGNKAKVMWLGVGNRELVVSVTNQQVRMLGQWPRTQPEPAAPLPTMRLSTSLPTIDDAPMLPASSPAVAGIMKLRARTSSVTIGRAPTQTGLPPINEDVATEDPDADLVWAKEILAATGGRR